MLGAHAGFALHGALRDEGAKLLAQLPHLRAHITTGVKGIALVARGVEKLHLGQGQLGKLLGAVPLLGANVVKDERGVDQFADCGFVHLQPQHAVVQLRRLERVAAQRILQRCGHVLERCLCHRQGARCADEQCKQFFHG